MGSCSTPNEVVRVLDQQADRPFGIERSQIGYAFFTKCRDDVIIGRRSVEDGLGEERRTLGLTADVEAVLSCWIDADQVPFEEGFHLARRAAHTLSRPSRQSARTKWQRWREVPALDRTTGCVIAALPGPAHSSMARLRSRSRRSCSPRASIAVAGAASSWWASSRLAGSMMWMWLVVRPRESAT